MDAKYIYAGTLAKTHEQELLSETQLEMLLSAKSVEEFETVLHDTYLAPYLASKEENESVSQLLEKSVTEARKTLIKNAPDPHLLDVLWIKYDFYNLRTIIKAERSGTSEEKCLSMCFNSGLYDPQTLRKHYIENSLANLDMTLKEASLEAKEARTASEIDAVINKNYFKAIQSLEPQKTNPFIKKYIKLLIDLYNITSRLRNISLEENGGKAPNVFISGGSFSESDLSEKNRILNAFNKMRGEKIWRDALEDFQKTGNFSLIEKTNDEVVLDFLDRESFELFSLAPLFAYFTAIKNNAQIIRAIYVGKTTGVSEHDIRFNLRKLYR